MTISEKNIALQKVDTIVIDIQKRESDDGSIFLHSAIPLESCPYRLTARLRHWAATTPGRVFLGRKKTDGIWQTLTYAQTYAAVERLAQALLNRNLSAAKPIVILSENSIEHALLALAAMHAGIPYSSVAPAYSLRSTDFLKLRYIIELLEPGLIFINNAAKYRQALLAISNGIEIVSVNGSPGLNTVSFEDLLQTPVTAIVEQAYQAIMPNTIAKILFTSGSTGLPKGVINTHENISTNWQQITQTFPFLRDEGHEFIDWLPWNHTFGGNHNFGLAVFNGGSFYIDDGNPTPEGIITTVANLKERKPSVYFNVPKGFEALIPYFRNDPVLGRQFFSNLKMLFYAGAGMPQHVWDAWEDLSIEFTGKKILIGTGLGCTESCPSALFASEPGGFAGLLGVPVPGLELKLVRVEGRLEARYRGKNIFPGYWKQPELTANSFDEEGFYCTGDALRFVDERDPGKGMVFDGRFAEDFKLSTGTWVRTGLLRSKMIAAGKGLIQDVVITGHDKNYIAAIVFAGLEYCKNFAGIEGTVSRKAVIYHKEVKRALQCLLDDLALGSTGSATYIKRAVFAGFELSIDKGELTDKGTINQRMVIANHPELLNLLYAGETGENILEAKQVRSDEMPGAITQHYET